MPNIGKKLRRAAVSVVEESSTEVTHPTPTFDVEHTDAQPKTTPTVIGPADVKSLHMKNFKKGPIA